MGKYLEYEVEDFAMDAEFINWVTNPDAENNQFWQEWLQQNPGKKRVVEEAKTIILSVGVTKKMEEEEKAMMWSQIEQQMNRSQPAKVLILKKPAKRINRKWYLSAAAIVLVLITSGFLYKYLDSTEVIRTQYGELRRIKLPDGSQVTLNANSVLTYDKNLGKEETRQIWLCGEAYFSIQHTPTNQRFIVHADDMDIEVLGTEFNVFKRSGKTKVSLNTGKVKLTFNKANGKVPSNILMAPGDLVEFSAIDNKFVKRRVIASNFSKWTQNKLVFDDTPLWEIAENLHQVYGWETVIKDTSLLNESLSGEIDTDNENELLESLSKAMDLKFTRKANRITISR